MVVVGPVGSGKSTLLASILGEAMLSGGAVRSRGSFALVEQEPVVFSASVRDNILFGKQEDPSRLAEVVCVCELQPDLAQLSHGLDTQVGEGGLNISGGQRARIALARACYADSDIYLLDDPLSAVDPNVRRRLYLNCLRGFLKSKAVVLVTHQLSAIEGATRVLALGSNGQPAFYGPASDFQEYHKSDSDSALSA